MVGRESAVQAVPTSTDTRDKSIWAGVRDRRYGGNTGEEALEAPSGRHIWCGTSLRRGRLRDGVGRYERVAMPTPSRCGQYQTYVNSRFIETPKGLLGNNQSASNNLYLVDEYPPVDLSKWGLKAFQNPPEVRPTDKNQPYPLTVEYTTPKTTSIDGCPLKVRSYNGKLVGPTLVARPGDTTVHHPPQRTPQRDAGRDHGRRDQEITQADVGMVPNAFNVTNLHTHGLHLLSKLTSEAERSDEALPRMVPVPTRCWVDVCCLRGVRRGLVSGVSSRWDRVGRRGESRRRRGAAGRSGAVTTGSPSRAASSSSSSRGDGVSTGRWLVLSGSGARGGLEWPRRRRRGAGVDERRL